MCGSFRWRESRMDIRLERTDVLESKLAGIMASVRSGHTEPQTMAVLMREAYSIRQELSRRKGDMPKAVDVDFEKYTTD
ncbi:MAG: hypothetical protein IK084_04335, partial [Bacteroidaceae bacterium]|nr:hypothetical protein [Bacteroidaceae bacterium]